MHPPASPPVGGPPPPPPCGAAPRPAPAPPPPAPPSALEPGRRPAPGRRTSTAAPCRKWRPPAPAPGPACQAWRQGWELFELLSMSDISCNDCNYGNVSVPLLLWQIPVVSLLVVSQMGHHCENIFTMVPHLENHKQTNHRHNHRQMSPGPVGHAPSQHTPQPPARLLAIKNKKMDRICFRPF